DDHAAVDSACNNARLPDGKQTAADTYVWAGEGSHFLWYHGDKGSYADEPDYGCDHTKMGPMGHQGTVSVTVSDGSWQCTATYGGTNDGTGPAAKPCTQVR